ncbi:MAG: CBS domain-containing protein [Crocinitomicaceae bacterium]|nr:CBS domain-containing protein [Crocinitomicaceae bacterium]
MNTNEKVSTIMTTGVITVDKNDHTLLDVKEIFRKEKIRHIPILSGGKLVGMISRNDIHRLSFGNMFEAQEGADEAIFEMLTIDQVMTGKPVAVSSAATILEVATIFSEGNFHSLPVMDGEQIKGIITSTDIIRYFLK